MPDYVGFENFIEFASTIPDRTVVYLGKHNEPQGTICTAVWKDPDQDIVYYYRVVANKKCLTPVEFLDKIADANEEGPEAENKVIQQAECRLLTDMREVIEYITSAATIAFISGTFSFPAHLNPELVLVNEAVFEEDADEVLNDIADFKADSDLNQTYQRLLMKENSANKEEN